MILPEMDTALVISITSSRDRFHFLIFKLVLEILLQVPSASVTSYEFKYFSDEDKLLELIQYGPVATWFDVADDFRFFYGPGVYYNPNICASYEEEEVPPECREEGGRGYTCLGDCKNKLPAHCDR